MALVPVLDLRAPHNDSGPAQMPSNLEAEQALLGALLYDNGAYERLSDRLGPHHFHEPFHQRLYAAIETHIRKGQLAEPILLADEFKRDPAFDELGGLRYLADLVDRAPPAANAPDYARAVYDLALRRELIRIGGDIAVMAQQAGDSELTARDQIETAEQQLYTLAESGSASTGFVPFADALRGAIDMAAEAYSRDGGLAIGKLSARARRLKRQHGLDLIVVDYLQLITGDSSRANENRVQEVSMITQGLKALAKELNVPIIALSQLSRQVENREDKRPQLADLRESGSIEQDADVVMFVYREAYYKGRGEPKEGTPEHLTWQEEMDEVMHLAEVIIGKQRHGPTGTVKLHFNGELTKFSNLANPGRFDPR